VETDIIYRCMRCNGEVEVVLTSDIYMPGTIRCPDCGHPVVVKRRAPIVTYRRAI